jgi:flagellar basal body rod protein FlgC
VQLFQGTVPATKVYRRKMDGFSAKQGNQCKAYTWLLLNETTTPHTVVFCNTYNEEQHPKASFNPSHYQTEYVAKVHAPKVESMEELEVTEWPEWIRNARAKSRKTK